MKEKKAYAMTVKITETMRKELIQISEEEKREFSDLIRYILQNEINKYKKTSKKTKPNYDDIIPERLKYYRKKYQKTQEEIAKELKITQSTYGNYEAGNRKINLNTLAQIAGIYEISIDEILGYEHTKNKIQ